MQDEQSPFNSRFLAACHGYSVQVERLEEGQSGEQEWHFVLTQAHSLTRKISWKTAIPTSCPADLSWPFMMGVKVGVELEVRPSSEAGSGVKEIGNSLLMARISKNMFECAVGTDLIISAQLNWWSTPQLWIQLFQYNYVVLVQLVLVQHNTDDQWCKAFGVTVCSIGTITWLL